MRELNYQPNATHSYESGSNAVGFPMIIGDHVVIIKDITDPKKTKKGDKWGCFFVFEDCKNSSVISMWVQCNEDGSWIDSFSSLGKFNRVCEAIGIGEGNYFLDAFLNRCLMINVERQEEYLRVKRMWMCCEEEREVAIDYLSRK